jgi:hypothetical protein
MAPPSQPSWMALGYTTVSQSEFFCECCGIEFADVKEAAIHCAGYCTQCNTSKKETIEEAIRSGEINTPYVRHHVQSLESVHSYYQPMLLDDKLFFVDIKTFRRYSEDECRTWIHSHLKEQYEEWFGPPSTWEKEGFGTPKICKMTSQSLDQLRLKTESFSMC